MVMRNSCTRIRCGHLPVYFADHYEVGFWNLEISKGKVGKFCVIRSVTYSIHVLTYNSAPGRVSISEHYRAQFFKTNDIVN